MNLGTIPVYVYTSTNRVSCPVHRVITTRVPWARQSFGFTKDFENPIARLALNLSKKTSFDFMEISWSTLGTIILRVLHDVVPNYNERFDNLVIIGIDETCDKKVIITLPQ